MGIGMLAGGGRGGWRWRWRLKGFLGVGGVGRRGGWIWGGRGLEFCERGCENELDMIYRGVFYFCYYVLNRLMVF